MRLFPYLRAIVKNIIVKMESELSRISKLTSIKNREIWKFQIRLNSYGVLNVTLGIEDKPADISTETDASARTESMQESWKDGITKAMRLRKE